MQVVILFLACFLQVGCVTNSFGIKGVKEFCLYLKTVEDAMKIRQHISECFERAKLPGISEEARAMGTRYRGSHCNAVYIFLSLLFFRCVGWVCVCGCWRADALLCFWLSLLNSGAPGAPVICGSWRRPNRCRDGCRDTRRRAAGGLRGSAITMHLHGSFSS